LNDHLIHGLRYFTWTVWGFFSLLIACK